MIASHKSPGTGPGHRSNPARPGARDWVYLATLVVVWGSAYGMTKIALGAIGPATLVSIRLWIGAAFLGAICLVSGARLPSLNDFRSWVALLAVAATGTLFPFTLISTAQQAVPSALAAIYVAAAPLCVAVLAHVLVAGERLTLPRIAGVVTGFAGVAVLFVPGLLAHDAGDGLPLLPQLMLLGAAVCYAVSGILVRISGLSVQPLALAFGFCACAALMSVPVAILSGEGWPAGVAAGPVWAVAGLGVFSTGVGALVYVLAIRGVGAVFTSNVGNLAPFWSLLVGAVLLGEHLPATAFVGLVMILAGIIFVQMAGRSGTDRDAVSR